MIEPIRELQHAWRRLRRAPLFTATTVLVLTLGIGATTAVFSVVNGVLLRPLPFDHPEQLVDLSHGIVVPGITHVEQSDASVLLYIRHARGFQGIGAYRDVDVNLAAASGQGAGAERVTGTRVNAALFGVLRAAPLLGRTFSADDDRPGAAPVVVLSEAVWKRRFGGDPALIGRPVVLDGVPTVVVGVMPASFHFPSAATEIWHPLRLDAAHTEPGSFNYRAVARLGDHVTPEAAAAELNRFLPHLLEEFPGQIPPELFAQVHLQAQVRPLRDVLVEDASRLLWILFGAGTLVLLISCANVANLFLVRSEARQRELAVRSALGAGRGMAFTQYASEAALLAVGGGLLAVLLAELTVKLLRLLPAGITLPRLAEVSVDARVVSFALLAMLFTVVAVSLVPLLRARRMPVSAVLRDSGRAATAGAAKQRARNALVVAQVAVALVLVAGSGLMWRSFARIRAVQPGFEGSHVLSMSVALPTVRYGGAVARMAYYDRVADAVRAVPGVATVGFVTGLPLAGSNDNGAVWVQDNALPPNAVPPVHEQAYASGSYFAAMGIPLLSGRTFGTADPALASREAVVSASFARRYWKTGSPLGRRLRPGLDGPWLTIVGVVGDVHIASLEKPAEEMIYMPLVSPDRDTVWTPGYMKIVVKTAGEPSASMAAVRDAVHHIDPTIPTFGEQPMSALVRSASARTRFTLLLLGVAGGIALVLGAVGIYGVMAYGVSLRQREIGVRMAMGARPADVRRMISTQGVALAVGGVVIGLAGALAVTRFMAGMLYGVSATDPLTLGATCVLLLLVALVASWLPARRAASVDPAVALRSD